MKTAMHHSHRRTLLRRCHSSPDQTHVHLLEIRHNTCPADYSRRFRAWKAHSRRDVGLSTPSPLGSEHIHHEIPPSCACYYCHGCCQIFFRRSWPCLAMDHCYCCCCCCYWSRLLWPVWRDAARDLNSNACDGLFHCRHFVHSYDHFGTFCDCCCCCWPQNWMEQRPSLTMPPMSTDTIARLLVPYDSILHSSVEDSISIPVDGMETHLDVTTSATVFVPEFSRYQC